MKFNKYLLSVLIGTSLTTGFTGCNDGEFLEEHSYNFDSNAFYTSESDMEMALNACYQEVQYMVMGVAHGLHSWMLMGIDYDTFTQTSGKDHFTTWDITSTDNGYSRHWYEYTYKLINRANTVIDMVNERDVEYSSDTKKEELLGAARFFRGWGYRILAGMFGNVPIVSSSVGTIETGYEANTRQEVWEFCKEDFAYAAQHLPKEATKPGQVIRAAADHYLAEICLALGDFQEAVSAATRVIDGTDGDYHIMTTRFGSRASEATDRYGNSLAAPAGAYWDLFRQDGNQNSEDNREALWVCQYNYNTYSTGGGGNVWYRARCNATEAYWLNGNVLNNRTKRTLDNGDQAYLFGVNVACFPKYDANGEEITNGSLKSIVPEADGRWEANIQRDSMGGNVSYLGCGLYINDYVKAEMGQGLWKNGKQGDREDIRGSEIMMQRNWYTPGGTRWKDELAKAIARSEEARRTGGNKNLIINVSDTAGISPRLWKFSDDIHHGDNKSYNCDWYLVRVAETYLLRAEAYLALNDKNSAAADINVVRNRANAPLCTPAEVNIDYILDERTRELLGEEHRSLTLNRLSVNPNCTYISDCYPVQDETTSNTLYERVRKYGYGFPNLTGSDQPREWDEAGKRYIPNIHPYNYQQPIPTQVIDANISVEYKQNTGY